MELEELDVNLVEIEQYRCRTCLFVSERTMCFTQISQLCYPSRTVKDILVQMVPQLEASLVDEDRICRSCLKTVIAYARFVSKCIEIEVQLNQDDEELTKALNDGPEIEEEEEQESGTLQNQRREDWPSEDVQVVENIEIVVENDLEKPLVHDHIYIKSEEVEEADQHLEKSNSMSGISDKNDEGVSYEAVLMEQDLLEEEDMMEEDTGEFVDTTDVSNDGQIIRIKEEVQDQDEDSKSMLEVYMDPDSGICEICGKLVKGRDMMRHLNSHENVSYQCCECNKIFKTKQLLKNHIAAVHEPDIVGFRYQCSECDKLFKNKGGLNSHFKLMHLNFAPFKCNYCDQTFGRADYLKKHLLCHEEKEKKISKTTPGKFLRFKNTVISENPLPCKICGKIYNGINKLKVHLQTHVVVKRYQCEFCNLTYKRWPSLKRHEKTHLESDEYFHRCNVCWKRLKSEEELKLHMASHGNPKYQCHICEEQFHRKYLFDNHYLLEHATPEDLENSKKEIIYDTLLELSNKIE